MHTRVKLLLILVAMTLAAADAAAEERVLGVVRSADQKEVRISVNPARRAGLALVQVFDAATGHAVRTLYAGPSSGVRDITLTKSSGLPAGAYTIRFRQGLELALDREVEPAAELKASYFNPTDVAILDKSVYVMDAGFAGLYDPADTPPIREWKTTKNATHSGRFHMLHGGYLYILSKEGTRSKIAVSELTPDDGKLAAECAAKKKKYDEAHPAAIYRFTRDGKPDPSFGDGGRVLSPVNMSGLRSLGVDDQGLIYLSSGWHNLTVLSADGDKPIHNIGGWDGDPHGPKCTPWARSLALGGTNRIYIPNEYGNMKVYERDKAGFGGIVSRVSLPKSVGVDRAIAADRQGRVYHIGNDHRVRKFVDSGAAIKLEYATELSDKLCSPTGPSASGGLVWVACRGPGFGPYWDSGGGGEIVLYWDDQDAKKFRPILRYGTPGASDAPMEFLNPSSAVMSRDHTEVWVTEDGLHNREGPPGNARVRRYVVQAAQMEDIAFDLPAWP